MRLLFSLQQFLLRQLQSARRFLLRGMRVQIALGFLVTYLVLMLALAPPRFAAQLLERLDYIVYDLRLNLMYEPLAPSEHKIVIVDYDQKSLEAEGQWPWSRFKLASLVTKLAENGALVVGFDVFFPEYERNVALELKARLQGDRALHDSMITLVPQLELLGSLLDADQQFADSMSATDVVLGFSFQRDGGVRSGALPAPIFNLADAGSWTPAVVRQGGYIGNVDVLQNAAAGAGFFDTIPDADGVVRRTPLIMQYEDKLYPTLPLDMARLYYFEKEFTPVMEQDLLGKFSQLVGIRMGKVLIPTDEAGRVLIPFRGPAGSFPYISATDVLNDNLTAEQKEQLVNSLVLVGTKSSVGLFDLRPTPMQSAYPGVEVHANILDALLSSSVQVEVNGAGASNNVSAMTDAFSAERPSPFPQRPDWQSGAIRAAIVVIGVALSLLYPYLGPALLLLVSMVFMAGLTLLNFELWGRFNLDTSLVILLLLVFMVTLVNIAYGFLREGNTKKIIKGMFSQYVPPAHIDAMLDHPDRYNFEGESKELSVLFSDVRDFTAISERLTAAELKRMLNDLFTPLTGIIFENNGTIDKYVGDMLMAFWGAPLDDPNHRNHAVSAALRMLAKIKELQHVFVEHGLPEIQIGIGVNSGMMNVGDMGSSYRRAYTVLGDAVNLGSRLEGLTKIYGVPLLIGEDTHAQLHGFVCRQIDRVRVKGKDRPVRIYQPLCLREEASAEQLASMDSYERAFAHYLAQQWDEAEHLFLQLLQAEPGTKLYALYLERIAQLRASALPTAWDGTYSFTSK
jgi:adenylate cyclase